MGRGHRRRYAYGAVEGENGATEALRADLVAKRALSSELLVERLSQGVEAGEIPCAADILAVARLYVTVQQGMSIQARDGVDRATLETVARSALAAWQPMIEG